MARRLAGSQAASWQVTMADTVSGTEPERRCCLRVQGRQGKQSHLRARLGTKQDHVLYLGVPLCPHPVRSCTAQYRDVDGTLPDHSPLRSTTSEGGILQLFGRHTHCHSWWQPPAPCGHYCPGHQPAPWHMSFPRCQYYQHSLQAATQITVWDRQCARMPSIKSWHLKTSTCRPSWCCEAVSEI